MSDRIHRIMRVAGAFADLPASEPLQTSPEFDAIDSQEQFKRVEDLLRRILEKTELQADPEKALDRLNPKQRDYNLLVVEALTNLFEGYRALRYQTEILTRTLADLGSKMPQWRDAFESALLENATRINQHSARNTSTSLL